MVKIVRTLSIIFLLGLWFLPLNSSVAQDEADSPSLGISSNAEKPNLDALLEEAADLTKAGRPIDARAKLQHAVMLYPKDYRAHLMLGQYYMVEVGHFKLAYQYILTAKKLFEEQNGTNDDGSFNEILSRQHAVLLYLVSEAQLNLDQYQDSLNTLDNFAKNYWMPWYPGTRAWVLMKLKRIDEAIRVAQGGILRQADLARTWNILGILLSVKDSRELSLQAFTKAIEAELNIGGSGQIATPLNNAGEVYRELFQDPLAESAWRFAVRLPDGCEHILPSLNLSILNIDQLRLFQAERDLSNFESCFASQSFREDTEHRSLLALSKGRVALHRNEIDSSIKLLTTASEEQQWFGRIGTNENDLRFAATVALAQALKAKASALRDTVRDSFCAGLEDKVTAVFLDIRSWWHNRQARRISLEELNDLEDLSIRNTDTMIEYPTLTSVISGFNSSSFRKRINRLVKKDPRPDAIPYYQLYLGANLLAHNKLNDAEELLNKALSQWRDIDRLAKAETIAQLVKLKEQKGGLFSTLSNEELTNIQKLKQDLYTLLPSRLRSSDFSLGVNLSLEVEASDQLPLAESLAGLLLRRRFHRVDHSKIGLSRFDLVLTARRDSANPNKTAVSFQLVDRDNLLPSVVETALLELDKPNKEEFINRWIEKVFLHKLDPAAGPLPQLPILRGVLANDQSSN